MISPDLLLAAGIAGVALVNYILKERSPAQYDVVALKCECGRLQPETRGTVIDIIANGKVVVVDFEDQIQAVPITVVRVV